MKGDFSRDSYRPSSQYSRVMMQQGRVQLDSDWNEQTSILLGYMRALTRDLFGPAAGPAGSCGFSVVTAEMLDGASKAEKDRIDAQLAPEKLEIGDNDLLVLPGRYYVGGLPVETTRAVRLRARTGFPEVEVDALNKHKWIAYLDVWEDFVAADQDPYIREAALNGVDTCGRARIRWQVRLLLDPETEEAIGELPKTGSGRLKARANPTEESDGLCSIEPDARYRGAENHLYRVEIHVGGKAGAGAAFNWSRDNGAVTFPIRSGKGNMVTLAHLGRDDTTTLIEGDWVELIDDDTAGVGLMAQVATVRRDDLQVELTSPSGAAVTSYTAEQAGERHAFLRRWDQRGDLSKSGGAIPIAEGAANEFELEDGVKVTFEAGGSYRPGDYWLIPARVATGDVEWPGGADTPQFELPHGPAHYYAPLLARGRNNRSATFQDMRCCIARLNCIDRERLAAPGAVPPPAAAEKK